MPPRAGGAAAIAAARNSKYSRLDAAKKHRRDVLACGRARRTPPRPSYQMMVANYVTSARIRRLDGGNSFQREFKFPNMADLLCGSYSERGFACVTIHLINPSVCIHLYDTGKIIACGAKHNIDAIAGMHLVIRRISDPFDGFGWRLKLTDYKISNVVASMALGYHLNLWALFDNGGCTYDPSLFPGLSYYPNGQRKPKPCVIIQSSGAVVVVGADDLQQATAVANAIDWEKYRLRTPPPPPPLLAAEFQSLAI